MNKIYKLVYSKILKQVVAVSELANSAGKGSIVKPPKVDSEKFADSTGSSKKTLLAFAVGSLFSVLPMGIASAAPSSRENTNTPDTPALALENDAAFNENLNYISDSGFNSKNAGVVSNDAINGAQVKYQQNVPVVNINNPNHEGVSDNRFHKFSTDTGVVFNNNAGTVSLKSSILAKKIAANPKLRREAKVILAQVTGNDRSTIKGVMEILGKKADLVIVNPNGIDLNGVNLLNTKNFTATTAEVGANNAHSLDVRRGSINVNGDLSTDDVNMIRLIAKAVKIKATISTTKADSKKSNIVVSAGSQKYNLDNDSVSNIKTDSASGQVAISGNAFGSMYGNQVNFIVTDTGAGVDFDGGIVADENINISADGDITFNNSYSKGSTTLASRSKDVKVKGQVKAQQKIKVQAAKVDTSKAQLHATKTVSVVATKDEAKVGTIISGDIEVAAKNKVSTAKNTKLLSNTAKVYAGEEVDYQGKVFVNKKLTTTTATSEQDKEGAYKTLTEATGEQATPSRKTTKIKFAGDVLVAGDTVLEADSVTYEGKAPVPADGSSTANAGNENNASGDKTSGTNENATEANYNFTFNNVSYSFDIDKEGAGITIKNGAIASNNVDLNYFSREEIPTKPFINTINGHYTVYRNTNIDLTKNGQKIVLRTQKQFDRLNSIFSSLNSSLMNINVAGIDLEKKENVLIGSSAIYKVNHFTNKGTIEAKGSFGIIANEDIRNNGTIVASGDLVLKTDANITLDGEAVAGGNTFMTGREINQSGLLHVGGDLEVRTDHYNLKARQGGSLRFANDKRSFGTNWNFHAMRKDKFHFEGNLPNIDTSGLYFSPAETLVVGNTTVGTFSDSEEGSVTSVDIRDNSALVADEDQGKGRLNVVNGRLYTGGTLKVDGDIHAEATAYKVPLIEILTHRANLSVDVQAFTLFNTKLNRKKTLYFNNLFDLIETLLNGEDIWQGAYKFDPMNAFNALLLDRDAGPLINKVLTSIFDADYRQTARHILRQKWTHFKENIDKYDASFLAPKAEIFAQNEIMQAQGNLFIGSKVARHSGATSDRFYTTGHNYYSTTDESALVRIENAHEVLLPEKIAGIQDTSNYLATLKKSLKRLPDGSYTLKRPAVLGLKPSDYKDISYLNLHDFTRNIGDDGVIAALVLEQIKDLGGASLSSGNRLKETFKNLKTSTEDYQRAYYSISPLEGEAKYRFSAQIKGETKKFATREEAVDFVEKTFDHIDFIEDSAYAAYFVPRVHLSEKTKSLLTNFDKVAASVTGVEAFTSLKNKATDVNLGSLSSKVINLQSDGEIKLRSKDGQFAVNANQSNIYTGSNFELEGNADFGDLTLAAKDNVTLSATAFITDKGDLSQQGIIKTNLAKIITRNLSMNAAKIFGKSDVKLQADNIKLKAKRSEASYYDSIAVKDSWSGRETIQSGAFVVGAAVQGKNVTITATKDIEMESADVVAKENATIMAGNNVTMTALNDHRYVAGIENKVTFSLNAQAQFGSYSTAANLITNLNYNMEGNIDRSIVTASDTATELTSPGTSLAGFSVGFSKEKTHYQHWESTFVNNNLDAKDLKVVAGKDLEIGNTNINALNVGKTEDGETKKALLSAENITQTQKISEREVRIRNRGFGASVGAYATSSVGDFASHIMSVVRAKDLNQRINPTYGLTALSDVAGMMTRDALGVGFRASIGGHNNYASLKLQMQNANVMSGDLAIGAQDVKLKNVYGQNLRDVDINARNLEISAGSVSSDKEIKSRSVEVSADLTAGVGLTGPSTSASGTFSISRNEGKEKTSTYSNSIINGRNININVEEGFSMIGANINAGENATVSAKYLNVESVIDDYESEKKGFSGSVTAGSSLVGGPVPFGQFGFSGSYHRERKHSPSRISSITASKNLNVKADDATLVSALVASDNGTVEFNKVHNTNIKTFEKINGGTGGFSLGGNTRGAVSGTIHGNQDANRDYQAIIRSTINEGVDLKGQLEGYTEVQGEHKVAYKVFEKVKYDKKDFWDVNRKLDKMTEVRKEANYQGTPFSFSFSSTMVQDSSRTVRKLLDVAKKTVDTFKGKNKTFGPAVDTAFKNTSNVPEGTLSTEHQLAKGRNLTPAGTTVPSADSTWHAFSNSAYVSNGFASGTEAANGHVALIGSANTGATYSGYGVNNYGTHPNKFFNPQDLEGKKNLLDKLRKKGNEGIYSNDADDKAPEIDPEVLKAQKEKVKYLDATAIGNIRYSTDLSDAGSLSINAHSGSSSAVSTGVQGFDQVASLFSTTAENSSNNLIYYRSITQQFGTVFRKRNLEYNLNPDDVLGAGFIHNIDLSSIRNHDKKPGETPTYIPEDDGSDINFGGNDGGNSNNHGDHSNSGNNPFAPAFGGANGNAQPGFDHNGNNGGNHFGNQDTNRPPSVIDTEGETPTKPTINADGSIDVPNVIVPEVNSGGGQAGKADVNSEGKVEEAKPEVPESPSVVEPKNPEVTPSPVAPEEPTTENKEEVTTEDNTPDASGEEPKATEPKDSGEKDSNDKDETPADGNAKNGEEIPLDNTRVLRKHVISDLTCYVMQKDPVLAAKALEAQRQALAARRSANEFDNYLNTHGEGRTATLFSVYSDSIVSTLGDSGVICLNSSSPLLKTDFNEVASTENSSAPTLPGKADPLDIVVVANSEVSKGELVSNDYLQSPTKAKVRFASFKKAEKPRQQLVKPVIAPTKKIIEIQTKLKKEGIDANKILFLGSKSVLNDVKETSGTARPQTVEELLKTKYKTKATQDKLFESTEF